MTKAVDLIVTDEVYCQINGLAEADYKSLHDNMAFFVEGYRWMPAFKMGRWDGKIPFLKDGKFFFRLLDRVEPFLTAWGYDINLQDKRKPVKPITQRVTEDLFKNRENVHVKLELRPYQVEIINTCLDQQSGFVIAGTGAGKTITCAGLADVMNTNDVRTIVIVPSDDLVTQTASTFRLAGLDVGIYSGSTKDLAHMSIIATWQALQNNPHLMKDFGCLIVDEAHGAKAAVIGELINNHGKHIPYRFGFTGTLPKPEIDRITLKGSIGEQIFEITSAELIEMGYLAQVEIEPVEIEDDVEEEFPDYSSEKAFLSKSKDRLDLIADIIISTCEKHGNTLVLVNSIKQGQLLQKLIKDSVFLYGDSDNDVRAEWYSSFADRDDLIVIATYGIASTGISIDRVFALVMIDAGKSYVRAIQTIGRSLRMGIDKFKAKVLDIHSKLKWSRKHFNERKKHYTEAQYPILKKTKYKV